MREDMGRGSGQLGPEWALDSVAAGVVVVDLDSLRAAYSRVKLRKDTETSRTRYYSFAAAHS